ncbi:MAG TPA: NAD(P)H-dependent oxidoreductase [Gemmataceae bacterium]|jgi:nitroreductase|nr:NAD(P)H-dependent oxidoreductase [Gemmataceae bacterium]
MTTASPEQVVTQLRWRYATKKFDATRKIPAETWTALEQSLVLTPSSYGLQPWRFFIVTDPAMKAQLPSHSWGQRQPQDCSHMLVLAIRSNLGEADIDRYLGRIAEVRDQSVESLGGYRKMMVGSLIDPQFDVNEWAARQVYIALGQFMACAALIGVDTCPMEGIDPAKYDEVLGIGAQGYRTIVACPAGYRAADDKYAQSPKVRFKTEEVIQVI